MKVHNTNLSPLNAAEESRKQQTRRVGLNAAGDDVHLSELVSRLRSMAADSPERQERLEQIARAFASGTYQMDAEATAAREAAARLEGEVAVLRARAHTDSSIEKTERRLGQLAATLVDSDRKAARG